MLTGRDSRSHCTLHVRERPRDRGEHREIHSRQARWHEGRFERARRDRRRGDGPARVAAEGARQGKGRRRRRPRDRGVQVARHRGADAARERDPARSRMGHPRQQAAGEECRAADGLREDRLRRDAAPAGCRTCSTTGRSAGSRKRAPTASRSCSTTRPSTPRTINDHKHAWVERIGDECRANDIPFFLEFIGYEEGADEKGLEFAKKKPEIVTGSMAEFTKDRYGVDVMKVEVPINMKFVEGSAVVRRPEGLLEAGGDGLLPPLGGRRDQAVHLSLGRRQQRRSSPNRWSWRPRRAPGSRACCAAARPGRTGSRSTASRGRTRSGRGSTIEGVKNIENVNARLKPAHPVVRVLRGEVSRRARVAPWSRSLLSKSFSPRRAPRTQRTQSLGFALRPRRPLR